MGSATTTFVSTLMNPGDAPNWSDKVGQVFENSHKTARVTPDGTTLLFSSSLPLTSYDNEGRKELFRYRAAPEGAPGSLVCVSCDPSGAPPLEDALLAGQGGSPSATPSEPTLSRNLSSDGDRVFFETPDPLVSQDENTDANPTCYPSGNVTVTGCDVYEWEADGEGTCESVAQDGGCLFLISSGKSSEQSYFGDASANGDDIFFFTREALVSTDTDHNVDVYDACVDCGKQQRPECEPGAALNPHTEECEEACENAKTCKPPPPKLPEELHPGSAVFSGPGNLVPPIEPAEKPKPELTTAQRLAAALKVCKKRPKAKRARCDASARRKYTPKKHTAKR